MKNWLGRAKFRKFSLIAAIAVVLISWAVWLFVGMKSKPEQVAPTAPMAKDEGASGNPAIELGAGTRMHHDPVFVTSDTNGGWSDGGYYVHNNVWNSAEAGPETLYAWAYNNWHVISTQPKTTSVKTYPNVHKDINNLDGAPLNNYSTITSSFAASTPHVGIYNVAYDLWLNGVGWGGGTIEFMIWTENFNQTPAGTRQSDTVNFGGKSYEIWRYSDGDANVITLVATQTMLSGTLNLKEMLDWTIGKGWLPADSTIHQICYGVEICSTNDKPATFTFTDFSVTMN